MRRTCRQLIACGRSLLRLFVCCTLVCVCPPASGQDESPGPVQSIPSRTELASSIRARLPSNGSVFMVYRNDRNEFVAEYDFTTRAFYSIRHWESLTMREAEGRFWSGSASPDGLRQYDGSWSPETADHVLDDYLPQLAVVRALEHDTVPVRIERSVEGELLVIATLPRGAWSPPAHKLSDYEIQRWGGPERLFRDVVYTLRDDLTVASKSHPIYRSFTDHPYQTLLYDVDPRSPAGLQVVHTLPQSLANSIRLAELRFDASGDQARFSKDGVLDFVAARRIEKRERIPVITAAEADANPQNRPVPLRGDRPPALSLRTGLMGAGAVLVAIGLLAWFRMRRG